MKDFLLAHWPGVREDLISVVDSFTDSDLGFIPFTGSWSAGRIMLHISNTADHWLHNGVIGPKFDRSAEKRFETLAEIKSRLQDEHQRTIALLKDFNVANWEHPFRFPGGHDYTPDWVFWHVFEHEIHHRGELSLILGLLDRAGLDV